MVWVGGGVGKLCILVIYQIYWVKIGGGNLPDPDNFLPNLVRVA